MENENLKPIEKLTPFTKMIMTIGTLPSSFYASMSYYESMVWLYEYLKNEVIPAVNNNAEAVEELQAKYIEFTGDINEEVGDFKEYINGKVDELETYMNNYFDNLDVQEEVNQKLDEMALNGTLTNLIKAYVDPIYEAYENTITERVDNQDTDINLFKSDINNQIDEINTKVEQATSGSPLVASSTSEMTETDRIYVNTTDGYWYYYDGDSWEQGGVYQSTGVSESDPVIDKIETSLYALYPVEGANPVRELYVIDSSTDLSNFKLHSIRNGYNDNYRVNFENSAGNAFVAYSKLYTTFARIPDIIPIFSTTDNSIVAYVVIDWTLLTSGTDNTYHIVPNERVKDLETNPIIKAYLDDKNINNNISLLNTETIGSYDNKDITNLVGSQSISNTEYIWFAYPINRITSFDTIVFKASIGTTNFYKITYNEDSPVLTYQLIKTINNEVDQEYKTIKFDSPITLEENEFIGINGDFYYGSNNNYKGRNYKLSNGNIGALTNQVYSFTAFNSKSLINRVDDIDNLINGIDLSRYGEVVLYNEKVNNQNADILGITNFDTYGLVVGNNKNYLNKSYSVADRTMSYVCKFNSGSVAKFCCGYPGSPDYTINSTVTINIANKTISINGVKQEICSILNTSDEYIISITKHYQNIAVNVKDTYSGEEFEMIATFNGTGGEGEGAVPGEVKVNTGMWNGYSIVYDNGNGFKISKIIITCSKCDVLAYGDSITEPEAYWPNNIFDKSWTQLCKKKMNNRFVSDGRSGTSYSAIMQRIYDELPLIKPKYCMITIGTNSTATATQLTTLIQYIKSLNIIPILNHIPCYNNNGNTTGFREANTIIDSVRQSENIKGANFDICTSIAHDGQTLDESTMWFEEYTNSEYYHHPNVKGSAVMFDQMLMDIPEIFE